MVDAALKPQVFFVLGYYISPLLILLVAQALARVPNAQRWSRSTASLTYLLAICSERR